MTKPLWPLKAMTHPPESLCERGARSNVELCRGAPA